MSPYYFGLFSEYLVICIYKIKFYRIICHRKKNFVGEVDIIASRGKYLVFIEVKARKCAITEHIVSYKQQNRIRRSAELFLSNNPQYCNYNIRFDLAFVQKNKLPLIIKNAW